MIRFNTIPPPSNNFQRRCIDWGTCGICAVAAKNSILLYSLNMTNNSISLLKVVEFSPCNILSLKFHNDEPLLAVSRSSGLLIYDCQKGQTRSGLKMEEFSSLLIQVEWCGDILICLSKSNVLYGVQIIPIEKEETQFSSSSYRRGSFINTDLPKCIILWEIELKGEFNGISIDQFHRCRILAYSNNSTVAFYQSDNPLTAPRFLFSYQFSKPILDAQFHPQIADIVFILTNTSTILSFEMQTKSVFFVIQELNTVMKFEQFILPSHSYNNIFVICSDSTIISYETTDKVQFRKKYWSSSVIRSQYFKSTNLGKFLSDRCFLLCNPLFDGMYLLYSKPIGLVLIKSSILFHKTTTNTTNNSIKDNSNNNNSINDNNDIKNTDSNNDANKADNNNDTKITENNNDTKNTENNNDTKNNNNDNNNTNNSIDINNSSFSLLELDTKKSYNYYVSLNKNTPRGMTSFDCCDGLIGYGNNDGDIYIIDLFKGDVKYHFNFQSKIVKFLFIDSKSFIWLSIQKDSNGKTKSANLSTTSSGSLSSLSNRDSSDLLENPNFNQMFHAGYFDISERTMIKFKNVTDIYSNRQFGIIQHGGFYFEIILNGTLRKSSSSRLRKIFLQTEISTCALQIEDELAIQCSSSFNDLKTAAEPEKVIKERHRAGSTLLRSNVSIISGSEANSSQLIDDSNIKDYSSDSDESNKSKKLGSKIVFITSQSQNLVIYDILTDKYTRKLQCPKEFKNARIIQVSYTRNLIVFASLDSKICLVNLKQSSSRIVSVQFTGIRKISFHEKGTKFVVLSNDNRMAVIEGSPQEESATTAPAYCNHFVTDFQSCSKQMILVQFVGRELKFLSEDLLLQTKQNTSTEFELLPTKVQRLNNVISSIEKKREVGELNASDFSFIFGCNLFQFESLIWSIVEKYFQSIEKDENKKMLQLSYYQYGDDQEYKSLTTFRSSLIQNNSTSYEASLYNLLNAIRCHDVVKMREAIIASNNNIFGVIAATLIDANISDGAASFLEQTAMDYFDKGKNLEATILMELVGNRLGAATILQSKNMWNASLEILVTLKKTEEARELIKNAAFHYLEINETKKAILLFISVGDFYPALSILKLANMDVFAYFLLKFVEKKTEIKMCSLSKRNLFNFEPLDSLKESIICGYNDFIK